MATWTTVLSAGAPSAPAAAAGPVARLATKTPEGTPNPCCDGPRRRRGGRHWLRVRLPALPNGTTGWGPRRALGGYRTVRTRLVVNVDPRRATLLRDGERVFRAPVGVGIAQWPTPRGNFFIRNRLARFRSAFYGPVAFGTSARSAVLTDWPGGGFVGIVSTERPDLLPGRSRTGASECEIALLRLSRLLFVGTPLRII